MINELKKSPTHCRPIYGTGNIKTKMALATPFSLAKADLCAFNPLTKVNGNDLVGLKTRKAKDLSILRLSFIFRLKVFYLIDTLSLA
jgi:hypothetical protein